MRYSPKQEQQTQNQQLLPEQQTQNQTELNHTPTLQGSSCKPAGERSKMLCHPPTHTPTATRSTAVHYPPPAAAPGQTLQITPRPHQVKTRSNHLPRGWPLEIIILVMI